MGYLSFQCTVGKFRLSPYYLDMLVMLFSDWLLEWKLVYLWNCIFWSTHHTEMLWYSNWLFNQPEIHSSHQIGCKIAATGKGFAATNFDNRTTIADVKIYLKEFMFKKKNFVLHRAKLIISAQIVGSNPTVHCSSIYHDQDRKSNKNKTNAKLKWKTKIL